MKLMSKIILKTQRINKEITVDLDPTGALILTSTVRGQFPGNEIKVIPTGVAVEIPEGYYGLVVEHPEFSTKVKMTIKPQTLTPENREEIKLNVFNFTSYPEPIAKNQVLAKLILIPAQDVELKRGTLSKPKVK